MSISHECNLKFHLQSYTSEQCTYIPKLIQMPVNFNKLLFIEKSLKIVSNLSDRVQQTVRTKMIFSFTKEFAGEWNCINVERRIFIADGMRERKVL